MMDRKALSGDTLAQSKVESDSETSGRHSVVSECHSSVAVIAGSSAAQDQRSSVRARVNVADVAGVVLLSDEQARRLIDVGARTWAELKATADWLPEPIILGPRLCRWDREELLHALRTRAPRGQRAAEPEQLRRARIERLKGQV